LGDGGEWAVMAWGGKSSWSGRCLRSSGVVSLKATGEEEELLEPVGGALSSHTKTQKGRELEAIYSNDHVNTYSILNHTFRI
jgi:hypothetical protein